jgi:hypothetical protein
MSNRVSRQEAVKGLIVQSVKGEVMLLENAAELPRTRSNVKVEAWAWDGQPYTTFVAASSLRWQ